MKISPPTTSLKGNTITFGQGTNDGIALALPQRTILRNNTITGALTGMRAGIQIGPRQFPGACSGNTSRLCLSTADCNIAGVDVGSQGTCTNIPPSQRVSWFSNDTTMQNNRVLTPFTQGIALAGKNTLVQGNTITGPAAPGGGGITLVGKYAGETTIITGNTISNVPNALILVKVFQQLSASAFGAQIRLNNFTGYTTAVCTSGDYTLPSELSVGQCSLDPATACNPQSDCSSVGKGTCTNFQGNYWGLACPAGFDLTKVLFDSSTPSQPTCTGAVQPNPNAVDSHPYGDSAFTVPCP